MEKTYPILPLTFLSLLNGTFMFLPNKSSNSYMRSSHIERNGNAYLKAKSSRNSKS
jgi:hypothetical protein